MLVLEARKAWVWMPLYILAWNFTHKQGRITWYANKNCLFTFIHPLEQTLSTNFWVSPRNIKHHLWVAWPFHYCCYWKNVPHIKKVLLNLISIKYVITHVTKTRGNVTWKNSWDMWLNLKMIWDLIQAPHGSSLNVWFGLKIWRNKICMPSGHFVFYFPCKEWYSLVFSILYN